MYKVARNVIFTKKKHFFSITPLTMYVLSDVGQKTAGDGYRRQNDSQLKFYHTLSKCTVGLYLKNQKCLKGTVPQNMFSLKSGHIGGIDL